MAANQLRYGPVVRKVDEEYALEPLNPLPNNTSWNDAIGFDPLAHLAEVSDFGDAMMLRNGQSFANPETPYAWFQGLHCIMPCPDQNDASRDDLSPSDDNQDESENNKNATIL